jgi:hypothetical protein
MLFLIASFIFTFSIKSTISKNFEYIPSTNYSS